MIDIRAEKIVTLSKASKLLPNNPHRSTLERWRLVGRHGIKLETVLIGGSRCTSEEALWRFIAAVTQAADGQPAEESHASRDAAAESAEQYLAANGVR